MTAKDLIGKNLSKDDFVFFWGHADRKSGTGKSCLSQWYARPFIVDGLCYNCMEQILMAEKARLFGDEDVEAQIMNESNQMAIKKLGRQVKGYDDAIWSKVRQQISVRGNYEKFSQNNDLKEFLLSNGENPLPDKSKPATKESWKTERWPKADDITEMKADIKIPKSALDILRKGHIPDAMEDHWFMYCDDKAIRYYRSWTGMPAFEVRYVKTATGAKITSLKMNHALCQWGVNGGEAGCALFLYLIAAETGRHSGLAWDNYLKAWNKLDKKYSKK